MSTRTVNLGLHINPSNNLPTAFELAEKKRYEKLRRASLDYGPTYATLNLNGETMKEILGYPA